MDLPSGTVTFLFTDIEGSTRLWEEQPDAMRSALERHDVILRTAIEANEGVVFKTIGDGFCAAFHIAPDALSASIAIQLALASEPWPNGIQIRVRMALHTGAAEVRDNDYFGQPLNRVSRLLAIGHGGQVLISSATQELIHDFLPPSVSLLAMGEHRLRDLHHAETVFQLQHLQLPTDFPPLKSLDNPALLHNLPLQLTSFIGREKEAAEVKKLLETSRLISLTGSGGCGKTRLALQVAANVLEKYPDGAWLVEFAPVSDPVLVPQIVAAALHLTEQSGKTCTQTLIEYLKSKRLLLVLDNCEHLLSACAAFTETLLRSCSQVKVLATSRERLAIAGEQTFRVPSLTVPVLKPTPTLEQVSQFESVRLFIERATLSNTTFVATDHNAPAVSAICHRLDGIPLALELAAARTRSLTVEEIRARLDNRFRLLTGGSKTALPRQQTLRALIDWSYDLLSAQEQLLLARLSVFAGGWTLEAAERVCSNEGSRSEETSSDASLEDWEVVDGLTGLVDKSLVIAETQGEVTRYRLLETVRQYASDRLTERGQTFVVQTRHRDYYLALAEEIRPHLESVEQAYWLAALEAEHDNLRQALHVCQQDADGGGAGLRLAGALAQFWEIRGYLSEGRQHLAAVLMRSVEPEYLKARAEALNGAGALAFSQGDSVSARALHEESLSIRQTLQDRPNVARSLSNLGSIAEAQGDYALSRRLLEESLAIRRELQDRRGIASSLNNLGNLASSQSDFASARTFYGESLTIWREIGNQRRVAVSLDNLGNAMMMQTDYTAARPVLEEALAINRVLQDTSGVAYSLFTLGNVLFGQGDYETARALFEESLTIRQELQDRRGIAYCLCCLGGIAEARKDYVTAHTFYQESLVLQQGLGNKMGIVGALDAFASLAYQVHQMEDAVGLWGAATSFREALGTPRPPDQNEKYASQINLIRIVMGEAAFAVAWEKGRALSWEEAVEYALKDTGAR